ncbi:MAG: NAD(+)/NADH kinase [Anaerolineae bacterium]|nr:NAD(+)/NADH kinase [Anaerolineae bacterium]
MMHNDTVSQSQIPQNIGVVYNALVHQARPLAEEIVAWLMARGVNTWFCTSNEYLASSLKPDLVITLGGDGTILRAMQKAAPAAVPLLGINMGRVGFLTETMPDRWQQVLTQVLAGNGRVEERMMLRVNLWRAGQQIAQEDALNDAVVSRGALSRTVRLQVMIDGAPLTRYVIDGLILSTATGSTAYAYAAGGPIMPPWLNNILIVPIAAHLCLDRPLVLNVEARVEIEVHTEIPGMLTVDGRLEGELLNNDIVRIERSPLYARFLRLRGRVDFYNTLVARLTPRNGD